MVAVQHKQGNKINAKQKLETNCSYKNVVKYCAVDSDELVGLLEQKVLEKLLGFSFLQNVLFCKGPYH